MNKFKATTHLEKKLKKLVKKQKKLCDADYFFKEIQDVVEMNQGAELVPDYSKICFISEYLQSKYDSGSIELYKSIYENDFYTVLDIFYDNQTLFNAGYDMELEKDTRKLLKLYQLVVQEYLMKEEDDEDEKME